MAIVKKKEDMRQKKLAKIAEIKKRKEELEEK